MRRPWVWLVVGIVLLASLRAILVRIGPDEVGVRTHNVGLVRGVQAADFGPGWHVRIPGVMSWNVLPARVRRLELTADTRHRSALGGEALVVQSSDGDRVVLEIDVFFRIRPGQAHLLLQDSGPGDAHVGLLTSLVSDKIRVVFGELLAEQFYDPEARGKSIARSIEVANEALAPRSLEVVDLALQSVQFEPKYEQKIKQKKLADQQVELSKAQSRAAAETAKVAAIEIDTSRRVQLVKTESAGEVARIKAEADVYQAEVQGQADVYKAEQTAMGTLVLGQAEATVRLAKTSALSGSGGANYAALEAVKNLKLDSVQFPTSGGDWFDPQDMAARLGARR